MAGKGDVVTFHQATATTPEEREQLKQKIIELLDQVTVKVTIVALVAEPKPPGEQ
jgi:hypothetical protein